jgi:transcriptional repressor NrdR
MRCPFCKEDDDKVIDSRATESGSVIRRRRECTACGRRYSTKERIETSGRLAVVKKDQTRAPFDRDKILGGVMTACYKRPVTTEQVQALIDGVEEEVFRKFDREVPSRFIGEAVAGRLRKLDKVAYVRFASVYRAFDDPEQFVEEVQDVKELTEQDHPGQQSLFE